MTLACKSQNIINIFCVFYFILPILLLNSFFKFFCQVNSRKIRFSDEKRKKTGKELRLFTPPTQSAESCKRFTEEMYTAIYEEKVRLNDTCL